MEFRGEVKHEETWSYFAVFITVKIVSLS